MLNNSSIFSDTSYIELYHLSSRLEIIEEFIPRKPEHSHKLELDTPRICLSSDLDGCIEGIGRAKVENICNGLKFMTLYKFKINATDKNLLSPEKVSSELRVHDALGNKEYCYLNKSLKPVSYERIMINEDGTINPIKVKELKYYLLLSRRELYLSLEEAVYDSNDKGDAVILVDPLVHSKDITAVIEETMKCHYEDEEPFFNEIDYIIPNKNQMFKFRHYYNDVERSSRLIKISEKVLNRDMLYEDELVFKISKSTILFNTIGKILKY